MAIATKMMAAMKGSIRWQWVVSMPPPNTFQLHLFHQFHYRFNFSRCAFPFLLYSFSFRFFYRSFFFSFLLSSICRQYAIREFLFSSLVPAPSQGGLAFKKRQRRKRNYIFIMRLFTNPFVSFISLPCLLLC